MSYEDTIRRFEKAQKPLTEGDKSELRLLLRSAGWRVLVRLVDSNRFPRLDAIINNEPAPDEIIERYLFKDGFEKGFIKGMLFVLSFPEALIEHETKVEETEDVI